MAKPKRVQPGRALTPADAKTGGTTNIDALVLSQQVTYPSILPPASELERYESLVPGAASMILNAFASQTRHRQDRERKVINHDIWLAWAGLIVAAALSFLTVGGGIYLASNGSALPGFGFSFLGVAGLAGVFVYGTKARGDERRDQFRVLRGQQERT